MRETWVQSLAREDPLEKEMATHSSILAWRIPWMEEPGGLQSTGSQRVRHDWATSLSLMFSFVRNPRSVFPSGCSLRAPISEGECSCWATFSSAFVVARVANFGHSSKYVVASYFNLHFTRWHMMWSIFSCDYLSSVFFGESSVKVFGQCLHQVCFLAVEF